MPGTLYVIATPIGNLADVTYRVIETLRSLDVLFCEDTRQTMRLLARYDLKVPLDSYREAAHAAKTARVVALLRDGKNIGLVSDAGTPTISDPGHRLVRDVIAALPAATIIPLPGPSAVVTALSASGFAADQFLFLGFPPHKKGRAAFFAEALNQPRAVVLYESPHRIAKTLEAVALIGPARQLCVARELTKIHETFYRGTAAEVMAGLKATSARGEFVVVIAPKE
jgi:16S rRNA (cytidine1402-2'-O)-methyltransferase